MYFINFITRTSRCQPSQCRRRHSLDVNEKMFNHGMKDPSRNHRLLLVNLARKKFGNAEISESVTWRVTPCERV